MHVLITGGTGLIGRALATDLLRDGHHVTILTRDPGSVRGLPKDVSLVKWDGCTSQGWGDLVNGADAIVNLAGENLSAGRWTPQRKLGILNSRVYAGQAIVQAIQQAKVKPGVLVQASGVGYYGVKKLELLDESALLGDDFLAAVSKDWEASTWAVEALGVRRVVIRSGVVFSRKGGALARMLLPFKCMVGGPLGSGNQWLSWIHIQDEVRAIRFLIENEKATGAFNLSASPITNFQFSRTLGKIMKRLSFFRVPAFGLRLMLGEMSTVVLEGQQVSNKKISDLGFQFQYPELEMAIKDLVI